METGPHGLSPRRARSRSPWLTRELDYLDFRLEALSALIGLDSGKQAVAQGKVSESFSLVALGQNEIRMKIDNGSSILPPASGGYARGDAASEARARQGRLGRLQTALLVVNASFCLAQLGFWVGGINPYNDLSIPMAPSVALLLIAASGLVFARGKADSRSRILSPALSVAACLLIAYLAALLLSPRAFAASVDIGSILLPRGGLRLGGIPMGRISPLTGLIIMLVLVCDLSVRHAGIRWLSRLIFFPAAVLSVVMLFGYIFGSPFLYASEIVPVSLPTSVSCIGLCLSFLLAQDDFMNLLSDFRGDSVSAQLLRVFVPFCVGSVLAACLIDPIRPAPALNPALVASMLALVILSSVVFLVMRISKSVGSRLERTFEELRSTQTELREAVRERDMYLKETHHRVKNNLQLVISLLSLGRFKAREGGQGQCESVLQTTIERIEGMAIIHDRLHQGAGRPSARLEDFVEALTRSLAFDRAGKTVRFEVDVGESEFGPDAMLPLGLILNELVTNSLKHAFAETPEPTIGISLIRTDGRYSLVYADNGMGMPEGFDAAGSATLGMVLIDSLVKQMRGSLRFANEGGLRCEIAFAPNAVAADER